MQTMITSPKTNREPLYDWLESIPAGVIMITAEGMIDLYNKQAQEMLGLEKMSKDWSEVLRQNVKEIVNEGNYICLKSGHTVLFKTQSLPNAKGQLVLLVDETEIHQSNLCTMQLQKLDSIEKLSASLAHQLRTPLSTAILYASSLPLDSSYQAKIMKPLLLIKQQIDDVLMVCKGQEKMIENMFIYDELQKMLMDYQQLHPGVNIELNSEKNCDKAIIIGHKASLMGALMNIIDNAIQAGKQQTFIEINLQLIGGELSIAVKDYGKGITQDELIRIEKPFYTTKENGTGLGLSIAKSILEAHQGRLAIESVENNYTIVSLYLPYSIWNG
ncbi:ATP-binding protein [Candidatus Berkiella aquae]|uniref:histidine kinase n=1 Tax=Candidatus Berkiella aquae TaxID=295108 RepID=A0A0Q9YVJ3_9GAMM|nr:ATP-binding protein [Candidatus Berkiella aquae]MCS5711429.1 ATP-binding protein [Candidatus Berkiella aquae]